MYSRLSQSEIDKLNLSGIIGSKIYYYEKLGSTFDKIKALPLSDGLTVVCSSQTSGCGRLGRTWNSPEGGVYFTFALLPPFNGFDIPFITLVCALGVCNALSKHADCLIKWPNDIVSDGKKLCGILTKNMASDGKIDAVLVGIGINVNNCSFPKELCHADSLTGITGTKHDENALLGEVLVEINRIYTCYEPMQILEQYKAKCVNPGREVTIHYANGSKDVRGVCTSILPDGSMVVSTAQGDINVHSGEVSVKGIYNKL
ncbi:MAG: biotin--[acetyl-CoA-carboxylase] ligase [Clostridia bacterium]|nr:biotin--[acetyl-CoA-carboxylase] ligase [Clostridia bacterium]